MSGTAPVNRGSQSDPPISPNARQMTGAGRGMGLGGRCMGGSGRGMGVGGGRGMGDGSGMNSGGNSRN